MLYDAIQHKYPDFKEQIRYQMTTVRRRIEELDEEVMTLDRYDIGF